MDALVRLYANEDDYEYWRRWKQLGNWSMNKTQGDVIKKSALKKRHMERTAGRCEDCGKDFAAAALQMHRLDASFAYDRTRNFGYAEENVALLCAACHEQREAAQR